MPGCSLRRARPATRTTPRSALSSSTRPPARVRRCTASSRRGSSWTAKGHLVGVDVAPDSQERLIVMLGGHEAVASTKEARVHIEGGGQKVTLTGSAAKLVPPGANPYVF